MVASCLTASCSWTLLEPEPRAEPINRGAETKDPRGRHHRTACESDVGDVGSKSSRKSSFQSRSSMGKDDMRLHLQPLRSHHTHGRCAQLRCDP
eukprot:701837-Rhodomonas_salina.2